jgi:hypothetical protein
MHPPLQPSATGSLRYWLKGGEQSASPRSMSSDGEDVEEAGADEALGEFAQQEQPRPDEGEDSEAEQETMAVPEVSCLRWLGLGTPLSILTDCARVIWFSGCEIGFGQAAKPGHMLELDAGTTFPV